MAEIFDSMSGWT